MEKAKVRKTEIAKSLIGRHRQFWSLFVFILGPRPLAGNVFNNYFKLFKPLPPKEQKTLFDYYAANELSC